MNLTDRVVLVTGASGGLGQQFVRQSLDRGAAKVYAGARRDHDWGDPRVVPLRLELAEQKTQVLGAHLGYADTPLIEHLTGVDKSDPAGRHRCPHPRRAGGRRRRGDRG